MKRIAMLNGTGPATVLNVAVWDGVSEWDPVGAGLCASTADVTSAPRVSPGWTYSNGAWTAPPAPAPAPDPAGFLRSVTLDGTITLPVRNALGTWLYPLGAALSVGDVGLIEAQWSNLVAGLPIAAADRSAIVAHATAHAIPGIN